MQKTAGSYIGKYVSKTYGKLLNDESFEDDEWSHDDDEAAPWKIAMYWATQRQFWSISQGVRDAIRLPENEPEPEPDPEVRKAAESFARDTVTRLTEAYCGDPTAGGFETPDLERRAAAAVRQVHASIEFLGAYPIWNLPASTLTAQPLSDLEDADRDPENPVNLASTGDRPPPAADVWGDAD
jgi:hypothetical protein